jgi:hypothetical protein
LPRILCTCGLPGGRPHYRSRTLVLCVPDVPFPPPHFNFESTAGCLCCFVRGLLKILRENLHSLTVGSTGYLWSSKLPTLPTYLSGRLRAVCRELLSWSSIASHRYNAYPDGHPHHVITMFPHFLRLKERMRVLRLLGAHVAHVYNWEPMYTIHRTFPNQLKID